MDFKNSYFEDEVREGFYIPGMTKRSWATQLDVLENVKKICEKHNIKWYADCGTLLGAIRHRGFIPWDDDLDICMMRDDYIRFNEIAAKELPKEYKILNIYTEAEYNNFLTRVVNHDVINTSSDFMSKNHGFPYVSGIDIFPLDYLYADEEKENKRRGRCQTVMEIAESFDQNVTLYGIENVIKKVESVSGYNVDRALPIMNALHRILDKMFCEADENESDAVALMRFWVLKHNHRYSKKFYENYLDYPFENTTIRVPWAYNEVLQIEYGRWESVNRKGGIHEYPFYTEQEQILAEQRGGKVSYKYYYQPVGPREESSEEKIFALIKNAHKMIEDLVSRTEWDAIVSLLEKCQELAISLGTAEENKYKEQANISVGKLEEYCEAVFSLAVKIQNNDEICDADYLILNELIIEAENEYKKLRGSGNSIFIVYKEKQWDDIRDLYELTAKKRDGKAYVMQVPYFEKNNEFQNAEQKTDKISFPADVNTLDYKTYDFGNNRPSEIYFTNPFDEYSSAEGIHPFFYSTNLRKLTDKLIYISIIDAGVPIDGDEKGMLTSKHYIVSPGVVNADEVITFNEDVAKLYRKVLEEETDGRGFDENKITVKTKIIQETKKNDKKTMLFYPGYSIGENDEEVIVAKIQEVIETLAENADRLKVIWLTDKAMDSQMSCINKKLFDQIQKMKEEFLAKSGDFCIDFDETKAVNESDAFYGAAGYVMNRCVLKEIPVMVWSQNLTRNAE